jgi:hypothetical protein
MSISPPADAVSTPDPAETLAPLEMPDAGVHRYLRRFNIGAVYIIAGSAGFPSIIGSGTDLATELAAARKAWPKDLDPLVLAAAWRCFDLRTAQQVVTLALASDLRQAKRDGPRFAVTVSEATVAITAAAGRLHFRLTDHAAVLARAKAAGVELESQLAAAQNAGQLSEFNHEYQRRRLAAKMVGRRFISYQEARARLRALLAATAAGKFNGDVIRRVFEGE